MQACGFGRYKFLEIEVETYQKGSLFSNCFAYAVTKQFLFAYHNFLVSHGVPLSSRLKRGSSLRMHPRTPSLVICTFVDEYLPIPKLEDLSLGCCEVMWTWCPIEGNLVNLEHQPKDLVMVSKCLQKSRHFSKTSKGHHIESHG